MSERLLATAPGSRPEAFGPREWTLLFATALIWGASYLWIELALRSFAPGLVAFLRVSLGLAAISLIPAARVAVDRTDRPRLIALGVGWFGLPMVTFPIAQNLGVATSVVGMLNGAMPLLTLLFASLLLRRAPARRQVAGVLVGFLGLVAVSWPQLRARDSAAIGVVIFLVTMTVNALFANVLVPLQQRYGALPVLWRTLGVAWLVTLPFAAVGLPGSSFSWTSALAMVPLGLLSTGVAFITWTTLIGRTGAARGSIVSYLVPVVAVVLGVVVLGERVAPIALLGAGAILGGAWLVSGREPPSVGRSVPGVPGGPPVQGIPDRLAAPHRAGSPSGDEGGASAAP